MGFSVALERARELDAYYKQHGKPVGPLHGLPITLKDHFQEVETLFVVRTRCEGLMTTYRDSHRLHFARSSIGPVGEQRFQYHYRIIMIRYRQASRHLV